MQLLLGVRQVLLAAAGTRCQSHHRLYTPKLALGISIHQFYSFVPPCTKLLPTTAVPSRSTSSNSTRLLLPMPCPDRRQHLPTTAAAAALQHTGRSLQTLLLPCA